MNVQRREPVRPEHCPYLALHDDRSTALGYASPWNYCYHAARPASVLVSHQDKVCLGPRYVDCPILLSDRWGRLPRTLRNKEHPALGQSHSWKKFAGLLLLVCLETALILHFHLYLLF